MIAKKTIHAIWNEINEKEITKFDSKMKKLLKAFNQCQKATTFYFQSLSGEMKDQMFKRRKIKKEVEEIEIQLSPLKT
jgi:hypothetical protein